MRLGFLAVRALLYLPVALLSITSNIIFPGACTSTSSATAFTEGLPFLAPLTLFAFTKIQCTVSTFVWNNLFLAESL
jgi:hypothetical protein